MSFECFAIRQKSTGKYLPMRWGKSRGFSHDEPSDGFPRIFRSERSARQALIAWVQGEWQMENVRYSVYGEYIDGGPRPTKVPTRDKSDMEIVKLSLSPVGANDPT